MVMKVLLVKKLWAGIITVFLCVLSGVVGYAVEVPRVPWEKDPAWTEVLEKAEANQQSILLDFHAPWCGPCKMLDSFVYNEKAVIAELATVLTVKFDIDVEANMHLKKSFDISLLPTLVWCDFKGREVARFTGFMDRDEFLEKMHEFRQAERDFGLINNQLQQFPEDPQLLFRMAELEVGRGDLSAAETQYRRLINMRFSLEENGESNRAAIRPIFLASAPCPALFCKAASYNIPLVTH